MLEFPGALATYWGGHEYMNEGVVGRGEKRGKWRGKERVWGEEKREWRREREGGGMFHLTLSHHPLW